MGNSHPNQQRVRRTSSSTSSNRKSSDIPGIVKKIDEKEYVFIALQSEVDKAVANNNKVALQSLASEIAAHIVDLNQLKNIELTSTNRGRVQRVIYNFELSLAKIKSICNYDTAMKKEHIRNSNLSHSSRFYDKEPDIVSDLIRFDSTTSTIHDSHGENENTLLNLPEPTYESPSQNLSKNNSLYLNQSQSFEEAFVSIESEFDVLKDQAQRPVEDVNEYYQMDKGVFYLYVKLKNLEVSENPGLNERRFKLIKELADFRTSLDKKAGELEEQRELNQEINTLELLLDSVPDNEMSKLRAKALLLQETVKRSSWDPQLNDRKIELLRRLAGFIEKIAYRSPSSSVENAGEHLYGNLQSVQEETSILEASQQQEMIYGNSSKNFNETNLQTDENSLDSDKTYSNPHEDDESIYGNVDVIRQNASSQIPRRLQRTGSNVSQRGTVYVNDDVVRQNNAYENHALGQENGKYNKEIINKRPLPLPRNYDEKVINDLPRNWQRLNEIFDKKILDDTDKSEVADILKHAEIARNLFERKIRKIMEKFEESVEL